MSVTISALRKRRSRPILRSSVLVVVLQFGDRIYTDEDDTMVDAVNGRDLHTQWGITR